MPLCAIALYEYINGRLLDIFITSSCLAFIYTSPPRKASTEHSVNLNDEDRNVLNLSSFHPQAHLLKPPPCRAHSHHASRIDVTEQDRQVYCASLIPHDIAYPAPSLVNNVLHGIYDVQGDLQTQLRKEQARP